MRALATAAVILGPLLIASAFALFIKGIWTAGADSGRFVGTGFLVFIVGGVIAFAGVLWFEDNPRGAR